jgi:transcriptional regulator with XRE-family HTH domain
MASKLAQRIFQAHLELSYRYGRRVTLAEFGELIAKAMERDEPFTAAAVSRWENGLQIPSLSVIEAIASVAGVDPGWISHGEKTAARGPLRPATPTSRGSAPAPIAQEPRPSPNPAIRSRARKNRPR